MFIDILNKYTLNKVIIKNKNTYYFFLVLVINSLIKYKKFKDALLQ